MFSTPPLVRRNHLAFLRRSAGICPAKACMSESDAQIERIQQSQNAPSSSLAPEEHKEVCAPPNSFADREGRQRVPIIKSNITNSLDCNRSSANEQNSRSIILEDRSILHQNTSNAIARRNVLPLSFIRSLTIPSPIFHLQTRRLSTSDSDLHL